MYLTHKPENLEVYFSVGRIYIYGLEDPQADVLYCNSFLMDATPAHYTIPTVVLTPKGLYTGNIDDEVSNYWSANRGFSCTLIPKFKSGQDAEVAFQVRNTARETGWHEFRAIFCGVTHKVEEIYIGKCPSWVSPRTEKDILDYVKIYGKYSRRTETFECIWE